ncbi:hypothetical protein E4T56_gene14288, partial [Termitomyces sp. T112]
MSSVVGLGDVCVCEGRRRRGPGAARAGGGGAGTSATENDDSATAPAQSAAAQFFRTTLIRGSGANQLPVRIAGGDVAGEGPDVGDVGNRVGAAVDDVARLVAGRGDHLRDDAHGQLRRAIAQVRPDPPGLVAPDETRPGPPPRLPPLPGAPHP